MELRGHPGETASKFRSVVRRQIIHCNKLTRAFDSSHIPCVKYCTVDFSEPPNLPPFNYFPSEKRIPKLGVTSKSDEKIADKKWVEIHHYFASVNRRGWCRHHTAAHLYTAPTQSGTTKLDPQVPVQQQLLHRRFFRFPHLPYLPFWDANSQLQSSPRCKNFILL